MTDARFFTFEIEEIVETGIEKIDIQHRELIETLNSLYNLCILEYKKEKIERSINYLENFIDIHFNTEEEYMEIYDYPLKYKHKSAHNEFREIAQLIKKTYKREKSSSKIVSIIEDKAVSWIYNHFKTEDLSLTDYLRCYMS